ncbi:mucin-2 isoform X7 [Eupeodes corollae]|uniref:mucin-2 isoform X7 n=1 Tax=Eupeodes corollae TaxID=290404 RepID=UPI0024904C01|nr:mucin-2 isoform X7 [Eupeodes corollae]
MEIECDLASIRDEDLLRKMWQQSEDFGRKKEIRSHLYKLRESRLREFYSTGGPAGGEIMNPATDMHFGKTPLTPSHGDSLVDQSFQSLKSKEIRDSLSPTHEIKFRNSGGVAGGVLVPDTTGWDVQTSSEVSPDGRAFRTESLAKTDGVEKIPGGHAEFAGRNEQKSSASHQGDDKNYVKKAAESSKTHLQEKVVIGDENSGRTEMKSSSVTSSSKVISSSSQQVFSSEDPGFDMQPRRLTNHQDQHYQNVLQKANNNSSSTVQSERQQFSRNERNERQETSSNTIEESKKYVDMDKASPEYQQHVQYLMSQPGAIVSNTVEYPKPGVKMITTVKKLPDGTTVKTKRYETEASAAAADTTSISQTMKQQQKISSNTSTTQKLTEKRIADSEDVFTRLSRTRDANVPASPRHAPETPSQEDIYSRLQQSRDTNEQKFSDSIDQRSTQILRDTNQHPGSRNAPIRRPSDLVENVEVISKTNKTIKKDLSQSIRSEKITSSDFIQNERDRYVRDHESPSRRGPDGYPEALAPITPSRHGRPQPDDYPTNGYNATEVIKQSSSSKSSAKFSENRRFSTETVESYHENENQDYTTQGYPSNRRPINEPKGQSPSGGRPGPDYSTHGFPSVRSDKPTQQHPSDKPRSPDEHNTTERVHIIHTDRNDTTRSNYTTNETRRNVTSTNEDYSTHGFPSVRAGTPTRDSPRRPLGAEPSPGESPRRPSGQEPPAHQARRPPTDGYSTHGFPSVKNGSPTEDSPRRPSGAEPTSQGRRPTTEDFSTHGFPSVKPGRSTPTQSAPQYESSPRVDREDTVSVTSDRSNSITYEKKIDAAHQAFARSLRCASPVESVRRDSTSDRHTPRSSIGSIRNSYSPSKRDGRSPSHDSVTNSESSRISSATVTKSHKPTEVRRLSSPKSPIGKSSPSHVSNETIDLTLTRKITARPSPDKAAGKPTTIKEEQPVIVEPILRKKIFGATEDFLASEGVIEKPINKNQYYQLGLSDATLPSSRLASKLLGTTTNTSRRAHHNTEEELNTLIDTATKHTTPHPQKSPVTPTTRSTKNKEPKTVQVQPKTIYSKKPLTAKPEGYITLSEASEITEKHNQTTDKHVSYPHYIPSAPKDDDERDLSPARSTSTVSSHKQVTTHRSTSKRVTEDISSRRPRRPSGNEPSTPTSSGRTPRGRAVPETVAARRNIFEKSPGDISPMPTNRRPSYMEPTKSSLEHRKDSLEITKTNYSRKSSVDEEPYEPSPRTSVKFGVGLKHKEEPKPKRKLSSSDIPNIEDVYELDLLEEMLNIVTLYEQRRRIRAQIRVVKKLLETKTKEEVSRMTKISTIRKTSSSSVRESPIPTSKRETPVRSEKYHPLTDDEIDSESIIESRHIEEHEEIIRERSISPKTKTSRIVTKVTEVRKIGEPTTQTTTTTTTNKRTPLKKDEPKDSKPIWATKNILKKPSDNEKVTRALSAKKTTSTSSSSMSRTQQTHRQRVATDDDCVTSSYGIGPTDEDGRPLFGIRALKKKTTTNTNNTVQPSETTKVTGTVITEKYYSENGAEPVGERKVTVYSTNPEDLVDMETQYDRRDSETVKREKLSKDGLTTVTKVQKIGKYKPGEIPSLTDDAEFTKATSKMVRRGSVKEMSEKFIRKESSSSVTEKSSGYPKAGLILRTRTNSGATADAADQYEVRAKSTEYDYDSEDDVEIRSSRKHSKVVTESEDETSEVRRKINTRSFLNSGGSKVTGVDDVLDRMRNADNVVVDGDTMEDREARSLLNKFLGASVLMSGMESMIPQMELRKSTAGADNKQEVKTTRVTKTIKSGTTGGSSSSPVARETCDFEEIWDEEILKQLLEKSTSYEERRSIRARLRQLMAEREACAELKASAKAELNETKVKTSTIVAEAEDESSGSEYEEIIEEYTASEDDDEDEETTTTTTTVIADKQQKDEVKEEKSTKQITEGIKKTTITKKEEPKSVESKKTVIVETTTVVVEEDNDDDDSSASHSKEKKLSAKSSKEEETNIVTKENDNDGDSDSVSDSKGLSTTTTEKTETKKEDGGVVTTTTKVTTRTISGAPKPVSPFAKFQQLDKQNSLQSPKSPLTPTTPGGSSTTPIFRFTDPALNARAATFKEQLLQWCQSKTQEYENVQITNFSASWTDGLAFCALIHHFLPDAFDYSKLNPKQRRYNFELAFRVADEKAGIAPLLDVEDMVVMKRPDWKCVFTYVQSIYRRFRNCQ